MYTYYVICYSVQCQSNRKLFIILYMCNMCADLVGKVPQLHVLCEYVQHPHHL